MKRREFLRATAGVAIGTSRRAAIQGLAGRYTLVPAPLGKALRTPDGRTVFEYMTSKPAETDMSANSVCCFAPLNSPAGERLTVFGSGHHQYRGVFFGWHTVEFREPIPQAAPRAGIARAAAPSPPTEVLARQNQPTRGNVLVGDFWGWGRYALQTGRVIKNRDVQLTNADRAAAELEIQNDWTIHDQVLMREALTTKVHAIPGAFVLDLAYKFTPVNVDVVLPEWSFGGFCVSGRSDAQAAYYSSPEGKVDLGNPSMIDGNTSWPDAPWYGRTHVLDGKTAGYAVVNHASNPRTRWWNPPITGNIQPSIVTYGEFKIPHGESLTLKYRIVAYDGEFPAARMNELASEFRGA